MATFAQDMARLSSLNFLGGLADVGAAVKEQKQNQNLVDLYEQFKTKSSQIDTTDKQVTDFNKVAKTSEQGGVSPSSDITQSLNLFSSLDRINKLNKAYQPYITAFSMLGEDGIRVAKAITNDLSTKIGVEQAKTEVPLKELQYKQLVDENTLTRNRIIDYNDAKAKNKQLQEVEDAISQSKIFQSISPIEQQVDPTTTYGKRTIDEYTNMVNSLTSEIVQQFPNLDKGILSKAIVMQLNAYDKSVKGKQERAINISNGGGNDNGFTNYDWTDNLNKLRTMSQEWVSLDDDTIMELKKYATAKQTVDEDTGMPTNIPEKIKSLYETFKPGGAFDTANNFIIGMTQGRWLSNENVIKDKDGKIKAIPVFKYSVGKDIDPRPTKIGMTMLTDEDKNVWGINREDLIIARNASDLLNGSVSYDPRWAGKFKEWTNNAPESNGSLFNNVYDGNYNPRKSANRGTSWRK
ncbi:MAG: hypothetical protein WC974_09665 [Thermoplasmata archaeon]